MSKANKEDYNLLPLYSESPLSAPDHPAGSPATHQPMFLRYMSIRYYCDAEASIPTSPISTPGTRFCLARTRLTTGELLSSGMNITGIFILVILTLILLSLFTGWGDLAGLIVRRIKAAVDSM
ncbi:hypothetical protein PENSPDRAFT_681986 [Peniophora sp. CONT]|nr:hypothetical protein PENSPDRAFT_681986 [Peniophora sp. CONT]